MAGKKIIDEKKRRLAWDARDKAFDEMQTAIFPLPMKDFKRIEQALTKFNWAWWDVFDFEKYGEK